MMNLWNCYNVKSMFGNTSTKYSFWTWPFLCLCTSFFLYFSISPWPSCPLTGLAIAREELQKTILQLWDFDLLVQVVHLAMKIRANHGNWQCSSYRIKSGPWAHGSFNSVGWRRASGLAVYHLDTLETFDGMAVDIGIQSTLRSSQATLTKILANICINIFLNQFPQKLQYPPISMVFETLAIVHATFAPRSKHGYYSPLGDEQQLRMGF